jgi:hypothetical protein
MIKVFSLEVLKMLEDPPIVEHLNIDNKILHISTITWEQESLKSELRLKSYNCFKVKDLEVIKFNSGRDLIVIMKSWSEA